MNDDLTSLANPPGWCADPLDVVIGRVPTGLAQYHVTHNWRYLPDATELHAVAIVNTKYDDPDPVFEAEGMKARVIAELLAWLGRNGL